MRRLYFFDKQFNYKDVIVINNFNPIVDIISTQSFKIETPLMPIVASGDICILKDNNEVVFIGNVLNVEESEKKTKTITISYIDELFNINGEVEDLSGNIITWITNTLTTNFISVSDNLQKISLSVVNNCATAYSGTYTFESTNIKDCLRNIFNYSGVYVDFEIDFAGNGSIDSLVCNIRSNIEENTIKLKYNMPIISEIKRTVTNSQNINKLVVLPDSSVTSGSRYEFYLLKDGTISTDASNVNRFENVKQDIKYYASDFTAESLLNTAKEVLGGEQFNHSIGFYIKHNSTFNISLYKKILFYDKDNIVYNSIITKIQYGTEFDYVELGVVRLKLTDKLQKKDTKTATSSSSSGGGSYVLPQATASTLGGIIAETKTTETNEVKIDTATGKLYASGVGSVNMDNVIDGETYVKTENNLTDTLKSNYDTAYTNTHTHSNKTLLDAITASYTTEEQTKVSNLSGTNTGDQTSADFTLSGLSEKNFSSLTNKPTTISGYGITDALNSSLKGANNGLAELDATGKVPSGQLPSYVDDVIEVASYSNLPTTGESGKIYVTLDTNITYRWSGSAYVEISSSLALGETSSTAYRGDRGKLAYEHSLLITGNPHQVTKSNVGLGNVDNTSDVDKPVSNAQQTALNLKVDKSSVKNTYSNSTTNTYSSSFIESNFAQILFTTPYYATKTATTTADLLSTMPTSSSTNYLTATTTNTAFDWNTPNYILTHTLISRLSLTSISKINITLPFSISANETVNFGYRIKVNGTAISSNQTLGAVDYNGDSGYSTINKINLEIITDLLTVKTNYAENDVVTFEIFTQQATTTSMTMRVYCGVTVSEINCNTYIEMAQFKSQLGSATPTSAGVMFGYTDTTNTSLGYNSFLSNTTGGKNVAIGKKALYLNTTGGLNIAIGCQSLMKNINGYQNTSIGDDSLYSNVSGKWNTAVGCQSLYLNNDGNYNTAIGYISLRNNNSGYKNIAIGHSSLFSNQEGYENIAIGYDAGSGTTTGSTNYADNKSIFIGNSTKSKTTFETNEIVIGDSAVGKGSNTVVLGNDDITDTYLKGNVHSSSLYTQTETNTLLNRRAVQPYIQRAYSGGNGIRLIGTYNYSTSVGDTRPLFYMVAKQGHGNGTSYLYWGEYIFGVSTTGVVTAKSILKISDGTYGKFYYRHDTVNKILYLYIYTGQYSSAYFSDLIQINAGDYSSYFTLASAGSVTTDTTTEGVNILYPTSSGIIATTLSAYPIGSIYMSVNSTSPASLFGGTWEALIGHFLFGAYDSFPVGTTGGSLNHTLTTSELPSHTHANTISVGASQTSHRHSFQRPADGNTNYSSGSSNPWWASSNVTEYTNYQQPSISVSASITNASVGNNTEFSIMPPYLCVYMWKRTA